MEAYFPARGPPPDSNLVDQILEVRNKEKIIAYLGEGRTDAWIMIELKLTADDYHELKSKALQVQVEAIQKKTTEEVFVEYLFQQSACIRDLTDLANEAYKKQHLQAQVSAVKGRSEIYDKIIKMGQDFGIIDKKPVRTESMLGVVVADLTDEDLKKRVASELGSLRGLMEKFGDKNILDVKPGRIHRRLLPGTQKKKVKSKTNRARANRVHKGRRVVKNRLGS